MKQEQSGEPIVGGGKSGGKSVGLLKIPAPRTGNWLKSYGSWKGFVAEIHRSTGQNLGGGVLKLSESSNEEKRV